MSRALSHRQAELLEFIVAHMKAHGISPSYDEMLAHLGLRSKNSVARLIGGLEYKGRIRRLTRRARSIEVLPHAALHWSNCPCDDCASARYVADLLLVNAMSNPAPAALAAVITAQWDAAGDENTLSIARIS